MYNQAVSHKLSEWGYSKDVEKCGINQYLTYPMQQ